MHNMEMKYIISIGTGRVSYTNLIRTRHHSKENNSRTLPLKIPPKIISMILPIQTRITSPTKPAKRRSLIKELQQRRPPTSIFSHRKILQRIHTPNRRRPRLPAQLPQIKIIIILQKITRVRIHDTVRTRPIPPRPTHLLIGLLDGLARSPVDNAADVEFVNAHSEGDGGDDDGYFSDEEFGAVAEGEAGVVGFYVGGYELLGGG